MQLAFGLGKATDLLRSKGTLREDLLKHMSPLGWEHINFLDEYRFPRHFFIVGQRRASLFRNWIKSSFGSGGVILSRTVY